MILLYLVARKELAQFGVSLFLTHLRGIPHHLIEHPCIEQCPKLSGWYRPSPCLHQRMESNPVLAAVRSHWLEMKADDGAE
jgi:hypothetical protein